MLSDTFKTENLKVLNSLHACSELEKVISKTEIFRCAILCLRNLQIFCEN